MEGGAVSAITKTQDARSAVRSAITDIEKALFLLPKEDPFGARPCLQEERKLLLDSANRITSMLYRVVKAQIEAEVKDAAKKREQSGAAP